MGSSDVVLYHDRDKVHVGGFHRYTIELSDAHVGDTLFVRVRNTELAALRAAYLNGPFTLYVDMTPHQYDEMVPTQQGAEPRYENHLKAGSHFSAELKVLERRQVWTVDVVSEILFTRHASVGYEVVVGTTKAASKLHGSAAQKKLTAAPLSGRFRVNKQDTASLWQLPIPRPREPLHVCVLTHGLVSNVTADMFYIKEMLDAAARKTGENLVVKGYTGNVCRTERGVKYLGQRVAEWVRSELIPTYQPAKLSFVSHSLGGDIQTYALGYLEAKYPEVLRDVELVNFVALASPFLGISNENPGYVRFALDFGVVGKTGRDLGLSWTPGSRPLLEELPNEHTQRVLRRFKHRTLYANAVHDGIVPLRTASMLYLDWRALGMASAAEHEHNTFEKSNANSTHPHFLRHHHDQNSVRHKQVEQPPHQAEHRHQAQSAQTEQAAQTEQPPHEHHHLYYQLLHNNRSSEHQDDSDSAKDKEWEDMRRELDGEKAIDSGPPTPDRTVPPLPPASPASGQSSPSSASPISSFLFGENREAKRLSRFQTVNSEGGVSLNEVGEMLPHKTSLIQSGMSLLLPPHPDRNFITNPDCRDNVVFHDRVYHPEDLPERRFKEKLSITKGRKEKVEIARSEERIARSYHEGMAWRKVLVQLLPEAHNNIIVRRRFSNAYGWPVVHHLVREHFVAPTESHEAALKQSDSSSSSLAGEHGLWNQSDEDKDSVTDAAHDHDPQRLSMLKIIPT